MDIGDGKRHMRLSRSARRSRIQLYLAARCLLSDLSGEKRDSLAARNRDQLLLWNIKLAELVDRFTVGNDCRSSFQCNSIRSWKAAWNV